ncbi:MAG: ABC transporter permease [Ancalomicrobiaceae bacterium]|nr:ABC transporter permease [Ancalomicrobiaceae bacterium]
MIRIPRKPGAAVDGPLYVILVAIIILMTILNPGRFATMSNIESMLYQLPVLAFLSIGMMVTMLSGGINLAIVSTANFTGIVTALMLKLMTDGDSASASATITIIAMAVGFAGCLLVGAFMGYLVAYLEVPAILATLGVMMLLDGINVVLTGGYTLSDFPDSLMAIGNDSVFGLPIPFVMLVVVIALMSVLLSRMPFGFKLYMLGSNPVSARFSNINAYKVLMGSYILSAAFSGLTGIVMMGQFNSVKANYAQSYVLVTVLACFLGRVDPFGGAGRLSSMVTGVVILQVISSGLNLMRADPFFVTAMWGAIILVLIVFTHFESWFGELRRMAKATAVNSEHGNGGPGKDRPRPID